MKKAVLSTPRGLRTCLKVIFHEPLVNRHVLARDESGRFFPGNGQTEIVMDITVPAKNTPRKPSPLLRYLRVPGSYKRSTERLTFQQPERRSHHRFRD